MGLRYQGISRLVMRSFHTLSLTLLTLLLPLSYLLLARFTSSQYPHHTAYYSTAISVVFHATPPLLYPLLSFACLAALLHVLTGQLLKAPASISWAFLCLFQACISLGIEATATSGTAPSIQASSIGPAMWVGRVVFVAGLYETMLVWERMFVRPVVDETMFDIAEIKEGPVDKLVMGVAFSALWLLILRDEVEPLVLAAAEEGLVDGIGCGDFIRRLVSYATIVTGTLRVVEVLVWVVNLFLLQCREADEGFVGYDTLEDDKV